MAQTRRWFAFIVFLLGSLAASLSAGEHGGQITFAGVPVPGATVTATQGDKRVTSVADDEGRYVLADLSDGVWSVRVEMLGFAPQTQEIKVAPDVPPTKWELAMVPFAELTQGRQVQRPAPPAPAITTPPAASRNAPTAKPDPTAKPGAPNTPARAAANASAPPPETVAPPVATNNDSAFSAADGLLISGSVNNSSASPFAQSAAFGNNRRGPRSLYNGSLGAVLGSSRFDARPYSFGSQRPLDPSYTDFQFLSTFGGPMMIPGIMRRGPNFFTGYQRRHDNNATSGSALMPTARERLGDFSQTLDPLGNPVAVIDPDTGQPFPNNAIPPDRISQQARSLLDLYPAPNLQGEDRVNYQTPILSSSVADVIQFRATQNVGRRGQLAGTLGYSRTAADTTNLFTFVDSTNASGLDTTVNYSLRLSQQTFIRTRYQFTRTTSNVVPYFSGRQNISGDAGITGNNQDPENWGPPGLTFSSGIAGVSTGQFSDNQNITQAATGEVLRTRGRHSLTIGGTARHHVIDVVSQQNARGIFGFTGATTGAAFGDFLLGLPQTSSIAFGNADKYLRAWSYDLYFNDDWRVSPTITINAGVRWEFETPLTERFNRLTNLDVAPDFSAVSPVTPDDPTGALTGREYSRSLLNADARLIQPRLALAWRPIAGSSLVVRAGYGIYRNTGLYQSITMLFAQQPPFSKALSVADSPLTPLTLADGFSSTAGVAPTTFAADPDFRVSYAQNWQVSAQRDLPASLTVLLTYLGTRGSNLIQEFIPNTAPPGVVPCLTCPAGFVYLTSGGTSLRNGAQVELRRRLRGGFTSTFRYTLAKATDNAASFSGATTAGSAIAQDWTDLEAERAPSNFDQRHLVTVQAQYTTGVGVAGGALLTGTPGALVKNWTVTAQLTTGSGLPVTPIYLSSVGRIGVTGSVRASTTGASTDDIPSGYYLNPAAYAAPAEGTWGNAGRNSETGPSQFELSAGVTRTFTWGQRLNLDFRLDITNLLNRVTFSAIDTSIGSPTFGLPTFANNMRKIQSTFRLRF